MPEIEKRRMYQMIPSHNDRQSLFGATGKKASTSRRWRLGARLGGRFCKKLLIIGSCIAIVLFISSLDTSEGEFDGYENWNWNPGEMSTWMYNMSVRMDHRRQHLQTACQSSGLDRRFNDSLHQPNTWEFLVNRKHHLVWCNVFKAASTSWMYNFNILAGYRPKFLQTTKQVPLQLARKRYPRPTLDDLVLAQNDSVTFLIVRHPLERLLSGYRDKIENALAHTYHQKLNAFIVLNYRKSDAITKKELLKNGWRRRRAVPTFSEFVDYVIDLYRQGKQLDMHWTPINGFCTPCQIHFDIILKFETLEDDQNYLIHSQKLEKWVRPQWKNPSKGQSKTTKLVQNYYSQLTSDQINMLYDIYRYDFQLFNYTLDGYLEHAKDLPTK